VDFCTGGIQHLSSIIGELRKYKSGFHVIIMLLLSYINRPLKNLQNLIAFQHTKLYGLTLLTVM
jgi:hypothetical protein